MEKTCQCGGKMNEGELISGIFGGTIVRIPDGYNFPKDYNVFPFVCEKCGKIEFYAGLRQNGNIFFGGVML